MQCHVQHDSASFFRSRFRIQNRFRAVTLFAQLLDLNRQRRLPCPVGRFISLLVMKLGEVLTTSLRLGMIRTEGFFKDGQRSLQEWLRLGVLTMPAVEHREVTKARGRVWMVGAEDFFADRQCALEERLRLGDLALLLVEHREVVEALSRVGMIRPEGFFKDHQRSLREWFRIGVLA